MGGDSYVHTYIHIYIYVYVIVYCGPYGGVFFLLLGAWPLLFS